MIQSVGPQVVGATEMRSSVDKSADKDLKSSQKETSFGKTLEDSMSSKSSKEETKESPPSEIKNSSEERSQTVAKPPGKNATVRQQAINEFMDSFESEFQISPTRLVEAMAQLTDQQLVQAPEETAEAVVSQLGLSDEETEKASAMYSALLLQLSQMPQMQKPEGKPVPEMQIGTGLSQQHILARKELAQSQKEGLASSVQKLNQNFWATPSSEVVAKMTVEEPETAVDVPAEQIPEMKLPPHLQGQMKESVSPALLAALAAHKATKAPEALQEGLPQEEAMPEAPDLVTEFQQAVEAPQGPQLKNQSAAQDFSGSQDSPFLFQQFAEAKKAVKQESLKEILKGSESTEFKKELSGLESVHAAPIKGESLKSDPLMPMTAVAPGVILKPEEQEAAVKQIMNQAQYLVKKGGGEMKVQMSPEGLGTIHLKVMLQDGKVNVQMSAENQEAKKTIESSLAELKTSLAAQKLSMDNVKVDVVGAASADTATQNQSNMNGHQQRDQTRQFWNQFNENFGSQGRRESFLEMPNLKGYARRDRDPLQSVEDTPRAKARSVEGRGSGLNLVV